MADTTTSVRLTAFEIALIRSAIIDAQPRITHEAWVEHWRPLQRKMEAAATQMIESPIA